MPVQIKEMIVQTKVCQEHLKSPEEENIEFLVNEALAKVLDHWKEATIQECLLRLEDLLRELRNK